MVQRIIDSRSSRDLAQVLLLFFLRLPKGFSVGRSFLVISVVWDLLSNATTVTLDFLQT